MIAVIAVAAGAGGALRHIMGGWLGWPRWLVLAGWLAAVGGALSVSLHGGDIAFAFLAAVLSTAALASLRDRASRLLVLLDYPWLAAQNASVILPAVAVLVFVAGHPAAWWALLGALPGVVGYQFEKHVLSPAWTGLGEWTTGAGVMGAIAWAALAA